MNEIIIKALLYIALAYEVVRFIRWATKNKTTRLNFCADKMDVEIGLLRVHILRGSTGVSVYVFNEEGKLAGQTQVDFPEPK